jgi:dUTP pyrophosphatase
MINPPKNVIQETSVEVPITIFQTSKYFTKMHKTPYTSISKCNSLEQLGQELYGKPINTDPRYLIYIITKIIDLYEQEKQKNNQILIKYTDDEYGIESKKLGLPKYTYFGEDAGLDLPVILTKEQQSLGFTIFPGDRTVLHSGLLIEPPHGYWSRIIHRSSTERRHRLRVIEGIIDWGYRAEVLTQVHNSNSYPITIQHGQRIAQLIICPLSCFSVKEATKLSDSLRKTKGFGHSGA